MSHSCPPAEILAAYLDGELVREERERLDEHVAGCADCAAVMAATLQFQAASEQAAMGRRPVRARTTTVAAALAAAVLALALGLTLRRPMAPVDPEAAAAASARRPILPRMTGGYRWALPAEVRRGSGGLSREVLRYLAGVDALRLLKGSSAADAESEAVAQVLMGQLDEGVAALSRAAAASPQQPALQSDLAAARLARGEREGAAEDVAAALEGTERALASSPRLPEALFNRALALEDLHLPRGAAAAWRAFLAVDGRSPWAREASRRLAACQVVSPPNGAQLRVEIAAAAAAKDRPRLALLVQEHRGLAHHVVDEDLLPAWGAAVLAGNASAAARALGAAREIGREWEAQTADVTLRRAVGEVDGAAGVNLAAAYRDLGVAAAAFAGFDLKAARLAADRALLGFPRDSPGAAWARLLRLASLAYGGGDLSADEAVLAGATLDATVEGRLEWIVGLRQARAGDLADAVIAYRRALAAYERIDDRERVAWLQFLLGEAYGYMGESGEGWRYRQVALAAAPAMTERGRAFSVLLGSAIVALLEERPHTAAAMLEELGTSGEPSEAVQTYLWRARARLRLGDRGRAARDLALATAWGTRLGADDRRGLAGDFLFTRGELAADPGQAIVAFTRAIDELHAAGREVGLPGALLRRARAERQAGKLADADADLREGLAVQRRQGLANDELSLWAVRLDGPDALSDERVGLELQRGDGARAFAVAEEGRAGELFAAASKGASAGREQLSLDGIRRRLEPGTALVFFEVLTDRVVAWRVAREGAGMVSLPVTPAELSVQVNALAADLAAGAWTGATRRVATALFAELVAPALAGWVGERLVLVPDESLNGVPFAALVDPVGGRYLVEEHALAVAPSAAMYLRSRERWRRASVAVPRRALVVGDPASDGRLFPGLSSLPGAREEALSVAAAYPERELLLGSSATRAAMLASAGHSEVVHFAGHALANALSPMRSSLVLAAGATPSQGALFGDEIARLRLPSTRVVVLSACGTGVGPLLPGEGPLSLARAFLASGVPAVVASLWPIADQPARRLMTSLHAGLRRGDEPMRALRAAQLAMLHGEDEALRSPAAWADLEALGD